MELYQPLFWTSKFRRGFLILLVLLKVYFQKSIKSRWEPLIFPYDELKDVYMPSKGGVWSGNQSTLSGSGFQDTI